MTTPCRRFIKKTTSCVFWLRWDWKRERNAPDPRRAAEIMAQIAAMPMDPFPKTEAEAQAHLEIVQSITALAVSHGRLETASRDHDKFLYGGQDGAR